MRAHGLIEGVPPSAPPELGADFEQLAGQPPATAADVQDLDSLARRNFTEDTAKPNGTSIVVLAEYAGIKVLLCADAHPTVVQRSLSRLVRDDEPLAVAAFKLPHHGSRGTSALNSPSGLKAAATSYRRTVSAPTIPTSRL